MSGLSNCRWNLWDLHQEDYEELHVCIFVHLCGTDQALRRKNENVHFCGTYYVPGITCETKISSQCSFAFQSVLALLTRCVREEDLKSVFSLVVHLRIVLALSTMCVNILKWWCLSGCADWWWQKYNWLRAPGPPSTKYKYTSHQACLPPNTNTHCTRPALDQIQRPQHHYGTNDGTANIDFAIVVESNQPTILACCCLLCFVDALWLCWAFVIKRWLCIPCMESVPFNVFLASIQSDLWSLSIPCVFCILSLIW